MPMNRPFCALVGAMLLVPTAGHGAEFSVLVKVGLKDTEPTEWRGKVEVVGGTIAGVTGWRFSQGDEVGEDGAWRLKTDPVPGARQPQTYPNGLIVDVDGAAGTVLKTSANDIEWEVSLGDLAFGRPMVHPSGQIAAQSAPRYTTLSGGDREDDYPAICAVSDGTLVAVWQSYADKDDVLWWSVCTDGKWGEAQRVPRFAGDLYQPTCAPDGNGGFWAVCARQDGGDFDLHALHCDGGKWREPVNISKAAGNDFNQALCADADGVVHCVWQGFRNGSSDILMARCVEGKWEAPVAIASSGANEWSPAIATGKAGTWVAWDTYQNGSYDIYAARIADGKPEEPRPVAASARFEAKASVACDDAGRVWIAWQDAGEDWGKDTGYTVPEAQRRQPLYRERNLKTACIENDRLFMAPDVALAMPEGERGFLEEPRLCCDQQGRLWLVFQHPVSIRTPRGNQVWNERAWEKYATYLDGDKWAPALYFPGKLARIDTFPGLTPAANGIAVAFHTDGREYGRIRVMTRNQVFATTLDAAGPAQDPQLAETPWPKAAVVRRDEARDIGRARRYVAEIGGRAFRLLRGDTHRHTEISWDGNGDGSVLDAYRYAMDAASLDFFMVSDHNQQTGVDLEYIWWRNYKLADVHNNSPAFNTLYGYERSCGYPNGHRNVIKAERDYPSFRHTNQPDDLKLLYEYCKRENAIMIAHTTGSNHGTRWDWFDQAYEPVIEIFQGCRTSYEYEGAPKSATPGDGQAQRTGYRPAGFLWRAWQQDLRLGIISSSDHGSTHYSYAGVYCEEPGRDGVIEGLKARHAFGATDNIVIDMRSGNHFMGEQWEQTEAPILDVQVLGTAPLTQVEIIRDFEFVHTLSPNEPEAKFTWMDNDFTPGTHLYYVRAQQADQSVAWGSPVWIRKG